MATTVTVGSSEFTITGTRTSGNFADGPGWVVVSSGSDTLTAITPNQTTEGGAVVHGAMKNPLNKEDAPQGFEQGYDDRLTNSRYNASLNLGLPASITAGDVIVKSVARLGINVELGDNQGKGLFSEYNALFVLSSAPNATDFAPAVYGWNGRGNPAPITLSTDIDTIVAGLPAYDLTGFDMPTVAEMVSYIDHFDPAYGRSNGTTRSNGAAYEPSSVYKNNISNYGRDRGVAIGMVGLHLIGNQATTAQKKTMLTAMISLGIQWGYPWFGVNVPFGGNGGHHQFHQMPMALAVKWAGLGGGDYTEIIAKAPGNIFADCFRIDQDWLDTNYVFHADNSKPMSFHRHTIQTVNGNNITVNTPRGVFEINGTRLRRESDNARATVQNPGGTTDVNTDDTFTIDAQPSPAFAPGNVVHFDFAVDPQVGDVDWDIRSSQGITNTNNFNPSWRSNYRGLNHYADDMVVMKALGAYVSDFDYVKEYVEQSNAANTPTATNDWPRHDDEGFDGHIGLSEFRAAYWDDIFAGETPPGPDPEPEPPTPGKRPLISGRTIIVAANGLPLIG